MTWKNPVDASPGEIWTADRAIYLVVKAQSEKYRAIGEGSPDILVEDVAKDSNPVGWGGVTSLNPMALESYVCDLAAYERSHGPLSLSEEARQLLTENGVVRGV